MPSYAITGANRGLGFAFLKHLSADPNNVVFGLARQVSSLEEKVAKELPDRKNVHVLRADLFDDKSMKDAADAVSKVTGGSLDMLIANAVYCPLEHILIELEPINQPGKDWEKYDKFMHEQFQANVLGNIHLLSYFQPLIAKGQIKKVVVLSSGHADIPLVIEANAPDQSIYAIAKAALNMAVAKFHAQYKDDGILYMVISPGVVDTGNFDMSIPYIRDGLMRMGAAFAKYAPNADPRPLAPEESASMVLDVVDKATIEKNGGIMVSHFGTQRYL